MHGWRDQQDTSRILFTDKMPLLISDGQEFNLQWRQEEENQRELRQRIKSHHQKKEVNSQDFSLSVAIK